MLKNKLLTVVVCGAFIIGGSGLAFANSDNKVVEDEVIPISLETQFTDIENHWAYDEIASIGAKGFWGELANEFKPAQTIQGADLEKYLDKVFEFENDFEFEFKNSEEVTRIEVAKAIQDSFKIKDLTIISTLVLPVYEDTKELDDYETSALSFVYNTGIMKGKTDELFHPHTPVTKAEIAVVLHRTLATLEHAKPIDEMN